MGEWQDISTAPKDGSDIRIKLIGWVNCFWCPDLKQWVLCRPFHMESMTQRPDMEWQPAPPHQGNRKG